MKKFFKKEFAIKPILSGFFLLFCIPLDHFVLVNLIWGGFLWVPKICVTNIKKKRMLL